MIWITVNIRVLPVCLVCGLLPPLFGLVCPDLQTVAICPFFWHLQQVAFLNLHCAAVWFFLIEHKVWGVCQTSPYQLCCSHLIVTPPPLLLND